MYGLGFGVGSAGATTILKSGGASFDVDAQSYFTATGITDLTLKNYINTYVLGLKSDNLFSKITLLNLLFLQDSVKCSYNLVDTSTYQLGFSSGYTFNSNGSQPNGTSSYITTGLAGATLGNNYMFCFYSQTDSTGTRTDLGQYNASSPLEILTQQSTGTMLADFPNSLQRVTVSVVDSKGNFIVNNNSSNRKKIFRNATKIYDGAYFSGLLASENIIIDAWGNLSQMRYSNRIKSLIAIGQNFTETDCTNLALRNNALMTSLGINTY